MVSTLGLNRLNAIEKQTNSCLFCLENSLTQKREAQIYFVGNMEDAGISIEEERCLEQILNEEVNLRYGEFWVYLNEIRDNKYELKRTVDELRSQLRKVKEDNERVLKDQEELNTILLAKIHNEEKYSNKDFK